MTKRDYYTNFFNRIEQESSILDDRALNSAGHVIHMAVDIDKVFTKEEFYQKFPNISKLKQKSFFDFL